jgi:hypothetical protein
MMPQPTVTENGTNPQNYDAVWTVGLTVGFGSIAAANPFPPDDIEKMPEVRQKIRVCRDAAASAAQVWCEEPCFT